MSASGVCNLASPTRIEGWAERRETFGCVRGTRGHAMTRRARRLRGALRPMTRDARLSALHRGGFSLGAALLSPAFAPDRLQRAPRSRVIVPGGRLPGPPGANGYKPPPQDATPRSAYISAKRLNFMDFQLGALSRPHLRPHPRTEAAHRLAQYQPLLHAEQRQQCQHVLSLSCPASGPCRARTRLLS